MALTVAGSAVADRRSACWRRKSAIVDPGADGAGAWLLLRRGAVAGRAATAGASVPAVAYLALRLRRAAVLAARGRATTAGAWRTRRCAGWSTSCSRRSCRGSRHHQLARHGPRRCPAVGRRPGRGWRWPGRSGACGPRWLLGFAAAGRRRRAGAGADAGRVGRTSTAMASPPSTAGLAAAGMGAASTGPGAIVIADRGAADVCWHGVNVMRRMREVGERAGDVLAGAWPMPWPAPTHTRCACGPSIRGEHWIYLRLTHEIPSYARRRHRRSRADGRDGRRCGLRDRGGWRRCGRRA